MIPVALSNVDIDAGAFHLLFAVVMAPGELNQGRYRMEHGVGGSPCTRRVELLKAIGLIEVQGPVVIPLKRQALPVKNCRLAAHRQEKVWNALRRSFPVTPLDLSHLADLSEDCTHRVLGAWRKRGDIAPVNALWPTEAGRAYVRMKYPKKRLPPVMPVRRKEE